MNEFSVFYAGRAGRKNWNQNIGHRSEMIGAFFVLIDIPMESQDFKGYYFLSKKACLVTLRSELTEVR